MVCHSMCRVLPDISQDRNQLDWTPTIPTGQTKSLMWRLSSCCGSDHMLVFATRYAKSIKTRPRYIRKRCYRNFCPANFIAAIQEVSWLEIFLCNDVNIAVQLLSNKITFILAPWPQSEPSRSGRSLPPGCLRLQLT
jgi:hypothetical protein